MQPPKRRKRLKEGFIEPPVSKTAKQARIDEIRSGESRGKPDLPSQIRQRIGKELLKKTQASVDALVLREASEEATARINQAIKKEEGFLNLYQGAKLNPKLHQRLMEVYEKRIAFLRQEQTRGELEELLILREMFVRKPKGVSEADYERYGRSINKRIDAILNPKGDMPKKERL